MIRLNKIQKKAVETTDSHLLVMAGAGSGKTRVITSKIIHLIKNKGVPPYAILAITFTNKAADEMKTRVKEVLSSTDMRHLQVRTFHSFGAMLLRSFISHLPPYDSRFTIIDPGDQKKIIKSLAEKAVKTAQINFILQLISSWKNDFLYPDAPFKSFAMYDTGSKEPGYYREWYKKYQDHLLKNNLLDFDDLIALPVQLSQKNSACNDYLKSRWRYVLVDEYQDTNTCQEKIIRLFYQNGATITAVGDDDQSIYSFRGADITNIRCFENNYKKSSVIQLEQNYRSTQSILDAANDVIAHNRRKYQKKLFTRNETGEYPSFTFYYSDREEAAETALEILKANDRGCAFAQTAVFYRTN
ncbi:MAG TPA: ATP-dependent helicase, partial [Spirochaetota bacterium]|nr:ATP-dependent helicase [Spirochaetota bacterium]